MENRQSVRVTIFGNEYTIRGEADGEYIRELARYVDGKMQEISTSARLSIPLKVGILAAINLADEVFRLRAARTGNGPEPGRESAGEPPGLAPEALSALCAHIEDVLREDEA